MSIPDHPRAVVTGAGSGLGRAFCLELARQGGRVLVSDVDLGAAEATALLMRAAGGEGVALRCDVARAAEVEQLAAEAQRRWGGIDVLVNNAGVAVSGPVEDVPLGDWDWILGINLMGVVHGCRAFVPLLRKQKAGHVINVASAAGLVSTPTMGPYNATKAAVVALSETLHAELHGSRVGVTVLCPTFFPTNIARASRATSPADPAIAEALMRRSKLDASGVAQYALAAAAAGHLYALPHADGRWLWRLKRLTPVGFQRLIPQVFAWQRRVGGRGQA